MLRDSSIAKLRINLPVSSRSIHSKTRNIEALQLPSVPETLELFRKALLAADEDKSGSLRQRDILDIATSVASPSYIHRFDVLFAICRSPEYADHRVSWLHVIDMLSADLNKLPKPRAATVASSNVVFDACFGAEIISTCNNVLLCIANLKLEDSHRSSEIVISRDDLQERLSSRACILDNIEGRLLLGYLSEDEIGLVTIPTSIVNPNLTGDAPSLYRTLLDLRSDCFRFADLLRNPDYLIRSFMSDQLCEKGRAFLVIPPISDGTRPQALSSLNPWEVRTIFRRNTSLCLPTTAWHVLLRNIPANTAGKLVYKDVVMFSVSFFLQYYDFNSLQDVTNFRDHLLYIQFTSRLTTSGRDISGGFSESRSLAVAGSASSQYEAVERTIISHISRAVWAEHGRGVLDVDIVGSVLLNCPMKDALSREELLGLAAELEYDETRCTLLSPIDHVRKFLPFIWSIRSFPFYMRITRHGLTEHPCMSEIDLTMYGLASNQIQSQKSRLNRSASGLDGRRMIRKQSDGIPLSGNGSGISAMSDELDIEQRKLLLVAQGRRTGSTK